MTLARSSSHVCRMSASLRPKSSYPPLSPLGPAFSIALSIDARCASVGASTPFLQPSTLVSRTFIGASMSSRIAASSRAASAAVTLTLIVCFSLSFSSLPLSFLSLSFFAIGLNDLSLSTIARCSCICVTEVFSTSELSHGWSARHVEPMALSVVRKVVCHQSIGNGASAAPLCWSAHSKSNHTYTASTLDCVAAYPSMISKRSATPIELVQHR